MKVSCKENAAKELEMVKKDKMTNFELVSAVMDAADKAFNDLRAQGQKVAINIMVSSDDCARAHSANYIDCSVVDLFDHGEATQECVKQVQQKRIQNKI